MRVYFTLLFVLAMSLEVAHAFEPSVGNRAYPIIGHDIVSDQVVSLEDLRGKWVLLEFWASW